MGQSGPKIKNGPVVAVQTAAGSEPSPLQLCVFATPLGWMGLAGRETAVSRLTVGHSSADAARREFSGDLSEADWHPKWRELLERYASGETVGFSQVNVELPPCSEFRRRILDAARALKRGETVTYGELAVRAGRPRAARAVGTAMSTNRIPIIIPCHRVVGSQGLGGYSAAQGLEFKRRLLELEGAEV